MGDIKMQDIDLYELFGIDIKSSVAEVKKAYRKKALTCHPDKNPDNPKAAELFHQLSKALEILTDASARVAYDKVLNGKKAAKIRHHELDSHRKKLKEDLEAREKEAKAQESKQKFCNLDTRTDEEKLQAEIERLRKQGSKQVEEEVEFVRRQVREEQACPKESVVTPAWDGNQHRLRVRWQAAKDDSVNGGYDYDKLHKIFNKYGDIAVLLVSNRKKGSALVEFITKNAAETAYQLEKGMVANPITMEWLNGLQDIKQRRSNGPQLSDINDQGGSKNGGIFPSVGEHKTTSSPSIPSFSFSPSLPNELSQRVDTDFESLVLRRLRQAEERKRLIEELKDNED